MIILCVFAAIDCGNLTDPLQGFVSINETSFGSAANYTCLDGYELNGNMSRVCLDSGVWSGNDPTCDRKPLMYILPSMETNEHSRS